MLTTVNPVIIISLDGEPRGKGRPRFTRSGHAFTPAATRTYEAALRWAAQEAMCGCNPLTGPVQVQMRALMPVPVSWPKWKQAAALTGAFRATGKPDVDNLIKVIDALNGVVWKDDSQITDVALTKLFSAKPALIIQVRPLTQAEKS